MSNDISSNGSERYEVVIRPEGGLGKEHAELLKKKLVQEGYYDPVVHVRSLDAECE